MIHFVAFSLKRAWEGFWRNAVMSLAATATMILMLLLLAGFFIILTGLNAGLEYVEQKVDVVAYVKSGASEQQIRDLQVKVESLPEAASVEFVTADEALQRFREREAKLGHEDLTKFLDTNPLRASLQVQLEDPRVYGGVVDYLEGRKDVIDKVQPIETFVDKLLTVTNALRTGGIVVLTLVGLTVLFVIVNTIRLAVVGRAEEIEIMRLVGASDAFVRWPFIFEGALVGMFGAAATLALLGLAADPLRGLMVSYFEVLPLQLGVLARDLSVLVVGAGLGLGVLGSWVSVRSYLAR